MDWETGSDIYTPLCIKQIINENQLYSTGNSTKGSLETQMGRKSKEEGIYVHMWLIHFAVQQKLTQHCKATRLQFKKKKKDCWQENSPSPTHVGAGLRVQESGSWCSGLLPEVRGISEQSSMQQLGKT